MHGDNWFWECLQGVHVCVQLAWYVYQLTTYARDNLLVFRISSNFWPLLYQLVRLSQGVHWHYRHHWQIRVSQQGKSESMLYVCVCVSGCYLAVLPCRWRALPIVAVFWSKLAWTWESSLPIGSKKSVTSTVRINWRSEALVFSILLVFSSRVFFFLVNADFFWISCLICLLYSLPCSHT